MAASKHRTWLKRLVLLAAHRSPLALRALTALRPIDRTEFSSARWEPEYRAGGWDWLWDSREAIHHQVIAAYCKPLQGKAAILDVGCGEGVLHDALRGVGYGRYVGIDLSETAIVRAARFADAQTRFMVAKAETFETAERFNLIVINECLYYLQDPPSLLVRLAGFLEPDGAFVISMAMGNMNEGLLMLNLWRDLERDFLVRDEISLLHDGGPVRIIKTLQPRQLDDQSITPRAGPGTRQTGSEPTSGKLGSTAPV